MRSNSPLNKTEPGAMVYEHSLEARVRDVSKPAVALPNYIHAEREGVIHLLQHQFANGRVLSAEQGHSGPAPPGLAS
jgi:hypothetical protein